MPDSWVAEHCPLCGAYRRYLPNEIFNGRLSHKLSGSAKKRDGLRVQVNFGQYNDRWHVQCNAEDCRTPIAPFVYMDSRMTLIRLLKFVGANEVELEDVYQTLKTWGQGSVQVTLAPGRKNLMRIRSPWNEGLLNP